MKYRLLAPGPTPVPDRVLSIMARSIVHHRTPVFERIFADCVQGLKWVFQTDNDVLTLSCSGTGGFEAIFQNFFSPGDTIINITGGKFGDRWGKMAKAFGLNVVSVEVPWGDSVTAQAVQEALKTHPGAKAVVCVASETSTGARNPYEQIGAEVKKLSDCILIVDAITALGVWDIQPKRDGIDILASGSQKALMLPPGLAFLSISEKAWALNAQSKMPRFYFDLAKERKAQAQNQTAYTPPVSLIVGLQEALLMMQEEGLQNIFARHARMAKATRAAMKAIGLPIFPKYPADSLTAVCAPAEIKSNSVYTGLRDRANLTIAGGQDALKGKIFRIAHLGYFDDLDVLTVLSALEIILRQEGYRSFEPGASIAAASTVLEEGFRPI
ncbi:MAG: alanine--glyoxylate aminotransferase family protein [Myxococcaceae bacterium]